MFGMNNNNSEAHDDASYIPPHLAIQAMRDSGYKNTAYALAELIDNSVQANAKSCEIFCIEEVIQLFIYFIFYVVHARTKGFR